jgi:hypothetical protein
MLVAVTLVAGLVTGCSSSGGGGSSAPTTAQLTAKLKNDPQIKQLESRAGSKAGRVKQVIGCIASALAKDADPNDLKRYVAGKLDLADIGGKAAGSAKRAQADTRNCAVQKLSG